MASLYSSLCGEGDMQIGNTGKAYVRQPGEAEMVFMQLNKDTNSISQHQLLSLSLGDPSLHSTLGSNMQPAGLQLSQNDHINNAMSGSKHTCFVLQEPRRSSTYLKATQDLLDEFVSVHKPMEMVKNNNGPHHYLPPSHCHDLGNTRTKLFCMLDEVDRRFNKYEREMQAVVSSFETVAGSGAALPYTLLALQTISRHFRRLRDAIKKHIQATQNPDSHSGGVLSRLRRVDQQLREQKALQQLVAIRQPWRPQRGLPETAVTTLRAWLFEHFLHPYPTDSEKVVLARETGLTRSQVANWFINARVRLWKPMIEEIYKEEFGGAEHESFHPTTVQQISAPDEREEASASVSVSGACMGLQRSHKDSSKHTAEKIESQGNENDASASSINVDKLEYYYMGPGNNHNRFSNTPLLSDFVA